MRKGWLGTVNVKVNPTASMPAALAAASDIYKKYNPSEPFAYSFMDDSKPCYQYIVSGLK